MSDWRHSGSLFLAGSGGPSHPHPAGGHVAVTLGFGSAFSWEMAALTLWSFERATVDATPFTSLVVLTDTPEQLDRHRAKVAQLRVQAYNLTALQALERIDRTLLPQDAVWFRFLLQARYIARYCQRSELVLLFDLKDILFGSSPFVLAPRSSATGRVHNTLTSFTEMYILRRGSWNYKMMLPFNTTYPGLADDIVQRQLVGLNDGLLLGPPRIVERHARRLGSGVTGVQPPPKRLDGLDQGLHNLLVYQKLLKSVGATETEDERAPSSEAQGTVDLGVPPYTLIQMTSNASCPVLTMHMLDANLYTCDEVDRDAPGSSVFRLRSVSTGQPFIIVHQWNRAPETVLRAVLCHHRHLLSLPRLRCGSKTACHPFRPERSLVRQDEREVLHKLVYPTIWRSMCPPSGCVTNEDDRIRMYT